jgi:tetratricopeptide (TPR) repeat protein
MDLSKHLEKAEEAVRKRNYPLAVDIYGKLLAMQPDDEAARAGLRRALFKKAEAKAPSKAVALLAGGVHLVSGSVASLLGRHAAAAKAYERYLVHDPLNEGVNLRLGHALQRAGYSRGALAVFQSFAAAQPRSLDAARNAGLLLHEAGRAEDAMAMYEQALKIDPRDQESLKARKNLAAEGAIKKTGIDTAKSSRDLIKDKGMQRELEKQTRLQLSSEEIERELADLEQKLADRPADVKSLRRIATLREMSGDLDGALASLVSAQKTSPNDVDLAEQVGDVRLRLQEKRVREAEGRGEAAALQAAKSALAEAQAAEFKRRVERNPTDLALRHQLGEALLSLGKTDEAIAELQQAVKDPRKKVEALLLLSRAFRRKNLIDLAASQLEKALEAAGGTGKLSKEIMYELGVLSQDRGNRDVALAHFSRILEQDIGFRDVARRVEELRSA